MDSELLATMQKDVAKLKADQEHIQRIQKKTSAIIFHWPQDEKDFEFKDLTNAAAKIAVVQKFFEKVLWVETQKYG